jgi:hypothetical protein
MAHNQAETCRGISYKISTFLIKLTVLMPIPVAARGKSAAKRLLGSWVRIRPGAWMFVSCECLCCQVEVSATGRSLVQRSPTNCGVCLSVIK